MKHLNTRDLMKLYRMLCMEDKENLTVEFYFRDENGHRLFTYSGIEFYDNDRCYGGTEKVHDLFIESLCNIDNTPADAEINKIIHNFKIDSIAYETYICGCDGTYRLYSRLTLYTVNGGKFKYDCDLNRYITPTEVYDLLDVFIK